MTASGKLQTVRSVSRSRSIANSFWSAWTRARWRRSLGGRMLSRTADRVPSRLGEAIPSSGRRMEVGCRSPATATNRPWLGSCGGWPRCSSRRDAQLGAVSLRRLAENMATGEVVGVATRRAAGLADPDRRSGSRARNPTAVRRATVSSRGRMDRPHGRTSTARLAALVIAGHGPAAHDVADAEAG